MLSWAQGMYIDAMGDHVPDRFDQLFVFVTPFKLPVYSTPQAQTVEDSTVLGEVDMPLTRGMSRCEAVRGTNVFESAEGELASIIGTRQKDHVVGARLEAMEAARGDQGVSKLQAQVGAIESQLAHITQLLVG